MFSSPTPAPAPRSLVSRTLRKAGLVPDGDTQMRDASGDRAGGRKKTTKISLNHRPKIIEAYKDKQGPSNSARTLKRTLQLGNPNSTLSILGASRSGTISRLRRNAISSPTSGPSALTTMPRRGVIPYWKEFVNSRWNAETRLLNLNNMAEDPIVRKHALTTPGIGGGTDKDASVIFKLASQLQPEVRSLDLSNNGLQGMHVGTLKHYLSRLDNLSLQNNKISRRELNYLSGSKESAEKFAHLKELILIGNPVRETDVTDPVKYRGEISRRFPSLTMLDGTPIVAISFGVDDGSTSTPPQQYSKNPRNFPFPMAGSLIAGVDGSLVSDFLVRFFSLFDNDRANLGTVYNPAATFSCACNAGVPERARVQKLHFDLPNQRKLEWGEWLAHSRNLSRLGGQPDKQISYLSVGNEAIVKRVMTLPSTKHDIAGPPEMFSLDCFPVPHGQQMALMVIVHGQFTQVPEEGLRSFDRTFIIVPAPEGSRAKAANWAVEIISDQMMIRSYSSPEAWKPGPMTSQGEGATTRPRRPHTAAPTFAGDPLDDIPEPQKSLVVQVCGRTKLTVKYAIDCLTQNGWNLEKAVSNFHEVKATLPSDAFIR